MLLFWRIRYLDSRDKKFEDRDLWLDTDTIEPVAKAAVEAIHDLKDSRSRRKMLRYRHLFRERTSSISLSEYLCGHNDSISTIFILDYFEDENGKELTNIFPPGTKRHDMEFALADKRPIPLDKVSLSKDYLNILGYFTRDLREMLSSAFYKNGPGQLTHFSGSSSSPTLRTAVTDEEIRSFVTIFRRLYMKNEPGNFLKAVAVFGEALQEHPLANWIKGIAGEYEKELSEKPDTMPIPRDRVTFSRKCLIDVFLYTKYAHQPDKNRERQFIEYLAAVGNQNPLLTWTFLTELWMCSLHMRNAGVYIADFFDRYCQYYKISPPILASVSSDNPGIGTLEKKQDREERILKEKAEELSQSLWAAAGNPAGGPGQFIDQALEQLREALR